jgi:hypothetical protein
MKLKCLPALYGMIWTNLKIQLVLLFAQPNIVAGFDINASGAYHFDGIFSFFSGYPVLPLQTASVR